MRPVPLRAQLLKIALQRRAHSDDTVSHALDLGEPLFVQLRVVQDFRGNTGSMDGRVGVEGSKESCLE